MINAVLRPPFRPSGFFHFSCLPPFSRPGKRDATSAFFGVILFFGLFFFSADDLGAQQPLKTPDEFLPHRLGEQFTPHHLLTDYFAYLAENAPKTMRLVRYGATHEARPLQYAVFSSPENMERLEQIRLDHLRSAGLADGNAGKAGTGIVWLSMSVHGNEPSGSECSMLLAWQLATQTDPEMKQWLQNTVVIVDPSLNPDGYDRYTHWYRMASNMQKNPDPNSREHREPWPGGRTNHYYFDLNRDWAWATQIETRQRLAVYHQWLPHVHADLHEQYIDANYYFAPAAEPIHEYITPWQRDFQVEIGANHARYFDANGWLYFTREVFDLFYPSYGDTYPLFNGAIGMTYEQAGHSAAGRTVEMAGGDTLTLHDRITHHLSTSRSTIEMTSRNAKRLADQFRDYYQKSASDPQGEYKAYLIPSATNDPNKLNDLCALLDRHHIRYGRAGASGSVAKAFGYRNGDLAGCNYEPGDLVISAFQPHGRLLQALFDPESRLSDSLTYDATAWALPFSFGLDAYALKQRLEPKAPFKPWEAPRIRLAAPPYSWCVHRRSLADMRFLSALLREGVRVRYAAQGFAVADQQFNPGALVINRADNPEIADRLDALILAAAANHNVTLHPLFSGMVTKGRDLGSADAFRLIPELRAAMVYGDDVDDNSYGHTWHFFEQSLQHPVSALPVDKLDRMVLDDYSVIVFPNGNYRLTESAQAALLQYVKQGGRIVAFEGGVKAFAGEETIDLKTREVSAADSGAQREPVLYRQRERAKISEALPGAIVQASLDASHPLAFGLGEVYHSLKTTADVFEMPSENSSTVIWLPKQYKSYGFIGSKLRPKLEQTPIATTQTLGRGHLLFLIDNPLYRGMWEEGKMLFANALMF